MNPLELLFILLAVAEVGVLVRRGVLTERAFASAPPRTGRFTLVDLIVGLGVLLFVISAVSMAAQRYGWVRSVSEEPPTAGEMLMMLLLTQTGAAAASVFFLVRARQFMDGGLDAAGITPRHIPAGIWLGLRGIVLVFPLIVLASFITKIIAAVLGYTTPLIAHTVLKLLVDDSWTAAHVGLVLSAIVLAPLLEELVFRGLFQTALRQGLVGHRWASIVTTSVVFALTHAGIADPLAFPSLFVLSLGLGYLYERTGNLWAPIVMHMAFNGLQVTLALTIARTVAPAP